MPTYAVRDVETNDVRLVDASRPETALKHVVTPRYNVTLASAADGVDAGRAGRGIEVAGAEPDVPATPIEQAAAANTGNVLDEVVPVPTETWPAHQAKEEGV